jgi:hypothetical protein
MGSNASEDNGRAYPAEAREEINSAASPRDKRSAQPLMIRGPMPYNGNAIVTTQRPAGMRRGKA